VPFTLAHPAAILPLRGWRYLRTAPLILGALVPDLPYYVPGSVGRYVPETHRFEASFTVDLALGYVALALVYVLRKPLTALLSARARFLCLSALEPFARPREWLFAALAILIGIWTHLVWDSFTHSDGWVVHRMDALSAPVTIGSYSGPLCHVLQYVSSVFGLLVMAVWYLRLPGGRAARLAPGAARSAAGPVLLLVAAAALLIGGVQATEHYYSGHTVYRTLNVLLTRSLAWFGLLYLVAGTIVTLEHAHEGVSDRSA
jgi:hypothetical protein